jgi:hypothetical protein
MVSARKFSADAGERATLGMKARSINLGHANHGQSRRRCIDAGARHCGVKALGQIIGTFVDAKAGAHVSGIRDDPRLRRRASFRRQSKPVEV